jgi:hypothetical protein
MIHDQSSLHWLVPVTLRAPKKVLFQLLEKLVLRRHLQRHHNVAAHETGMGFNFTFHLTILHGVSEISKQVRLAAILPVVDWW